MAKPTARQRTPRYEVWLPKIREIRIARAETGVTLTQMAQDIGKNRAYLCEVLRGRKTSEPTARQIAAYFEVPVEQLFQRIDLENPDKASAA